MNPSRRLPEYVGELSKSAVQLKDSEVNILLQRPTARGWKEWTFDAERAREGTEIPWSYPIGSSLHPKAGSEISIHLQPGTINFQYRIGPADAGQRVATVSSQLGDSTNVNEEFLSGRAIYYDCLKEILGLDEVQDLSAQDVSRLRPQIENEARTNVILVFNGLRKVENNRWSARLLFMSQKKLAWDRVAERVTLRTREAQTERGSRLRKASTA